MRHLLRVAIATILSAALVSAGTPPPDPIVGIVAEANNCNLAPGTTLFVNTEVWTMINGSATVLLTKPSATLLLTSNSRMRFLPAKDGSVVQLEEGTLRFSSKQPINLRALSGSVEFRSQGSGLSSGEIRILGKNRIAVVAVDAPILVSANGASLLIPTGLEYTLGLPSDMPQESSTPSDEKSRRKRGFIIFGVSLALTTLTTGLLLSATQSSRATFASPFFP